ncbi:MAG: hypothetical protein F6K30_23520, partial [Cyanothece sp. SIO2G6]|nr:hypothetical protein [Cyanothece sp. SIO2G6]
MAAQMSAVMVRAVAIALSLVVLVTSPLTAGAMPIPLLAQIPIGAHSFVADAVSRVGASVVRVDTERIITRSVNPSPFFNDPFFDDPFFRQFFGDRPQSA